MATVWLLLRADLRHRWRALLGLALLLGLVGGVVLTAAAGARRTDTVYPRLMAWSNASQLDIVAQGTGQNGYYTSTTPPSVTSRSCSARCWPCSRSAPSRTCCSPASVAGGGTWLC